jgi:RNA recognition motif-containing protein
LLIRSTILLCPLCCLLSVLTVERHRGFGFVVFQDPSDAQAALDNMSDSELYGRVLKCNLAKPGAAGAAGGARTGGAIWAGEAADEFYGNVPKSAEAVDAAIMHAQNQDAKARAATQQQ